MRNTDLFLIVSLLILFLFLDFVFYYGTYTVELDKTFLTLATFLFALFSGFLISRQSARYGTLRKLLADFDGDLTGLYRSFGHFGADVQEAVGKIIRAHYEKTLTNGWEYPFVHKTTTLTDINVLLKRTIQRVGTDGIYGAVTSRTLFVLSGMQRARKGMASLYRERTPLMQWVVIYLLAIILVAVVSVLDSHFNIYAATVKAAFVMSIVMVLVLLYRLDNLNLFGDAVGVQTAHDTIDIISGKK